MSTSKKTIFTPMLAILFGFVNVAIADTCPTKLARDSNGYWYSDSKPGWKSHKPMPEGVTLKAVNFGGVVYSPERHRIACVYKASNGKWVALVSNVHHGILIDKKAMDDSGEKPAWQFSKKHKDYACGQPNVTRIQGCPFELAD